MRGVGPLRDGAVDVGHAPEAGGNDTLSLEVRPPAGEVARAAFRPGAAASGPGSIPPPVRPASAVLLLLSLPSWSSHPPGRSPGDGDVLSETVYAFPCFAEAPGYTPGQWLDYAIATFDQLYDEGAAAPKIMSLGLHLRIIGRPGRIGALARFIDHVRSKPDVWCATRLAIAQHFARSVPAPS